MKFGGYSGVTLDMGLLDVNGARTAIQQLMARGRIPSELAQEALSQLG